MARTVREFTPISGKQVSLYSCGLTVYDEPHIGNWSNYIAWDTLVRVLRHAGYDVTHVQNYTDVGHLVSDEDHGEDKMVKAAKRERKTAWDIASHYIERAEQGMTVLNLSQPTHKPRATDYIPQQIDFVKALEKKGFTYAIPDEGIYFDTSKLADYGKLARLDVAGQRAGERIDATGKKQATDFALWKFSPKNGKRDMEWESPWGKGFPGWHLECSVMSRELLGDTIDIHTGGIDHIPVHHTNEIAQTETVTGENFVNYWLHRNFIKVDGRKMSKSLGNIYSLEDLETRGFHPLDFRLLMLQSHYRTESNFSWENLAAAQQKRLSIQAFADLRYQTSSQANKLTDDYFSAYTDKIVGALYNDLNTPEALALLNAIIDDVATGPVLIHPDQQHEFITFLVFLDAVLGLSLLRSKDISKEQAEKVAARHIARDSKNYALSDTLREQLEDEGIILNDTSLGAVWSRES